MSKPTEPGWYWYLPSWPKKPIIVHVIKGQDGEPLWVPNHGYADRLNGIWGPRIEEWNPLVLSNKHRHILEHTLGSFEPSGWYRNHYCASEGHFNYADLVELEKLGFMERAKATDFCSSDTIVFRVTQEGKNALIG